MARELSSGTVRVLTPPGAAGIAVVELRGDVQRFAQKHLKPKDERSESSGPSAGEIRGFAPLLLRLPLHRLLIDDAEVIDDPLVLLREADVLEVHLHGGPWIVRRTVQLAEQGGFVQAERSPVTIEDWLPWMKTERGMRLLLDQRHRTGEPDPEDRTLQRMAFPARVALIGPPNVGKSTLANRLLGRERFITADLPGTTRDWVEELADVDGVPMILTDTPGRRATTDTIEAEAIRRSDSAIAAAEVVIAVHDPATTEPWPRADVRVLNKCDQPHGSTDAIEVSATAGTGVDDLVAALHAALGINLAAHDRRIPFPTR